MEFTKHDLGKLLKAVTRRRKWSPKALNRLAILAGFQDWKSLSRALRGFEA